MNLDSKIDDLYKLPPSEFTAARNGLAKAAGGDDAKRVKSLAKPTLVPWAVNQLYWKSKPVYEQLLKSGDALRSAQIAALKGRDADVQRASEAHKKALADAMREAEKLAAAAALNPDADTLSRMLEALSLAPERPEHPGRFTELMQPAGFEALAGVGALKGVSALRAVGSGTTVNPAKAGSHNARAAKEEVERERAERAAEMEREREAARERKEAEARLKAAEQTLERARAAEAQARNAYDSAQEERRAAESALFAARKAVRDL